MTVIPLWAWALAVVLGAASAVTRGWLVERLPCRRVPLGVLVANVLACAVAGAAVAARDRMDVAWFFVVVGGLCGALSTVADLSRRHRPARARGRRGRCGRQPHAQRGARAGRQLGGIPRRQLTKRSRTMSTSASGAGSPASSSGGLTWSAPQLAARSAKKPGASR